MRKVALLLVIALLTLTALPLAQAQEETPPTIGQIVMDSASNADEPQFTILLAALQAADPAFLDRVSNPDTIAATFTTVFAPTDEAFLAAFDALGVTPADVLADPDLLNSVLAYHVMPGIFTAENFAARSGALYGTFYPHFPLTITVEDDGTVKADNATVITADIAALNGIIHVIDSVLLPMMGEDMMEGEMMEEPTQSIYEILQSREDFSIFLEAMDMMGFQTDLSITPYTLFIPTDAVFNAFFESAGVTKEELLANTDTITPILFYHFLAGEFHAADIVTLAEAGEEGAVFGTQQPGTFMTLTLDGESVKIDGAATVVEADILATNGVIHVIDSILLPSGG
jgi:uncharacterized surface protein with fasciclin (FAS1) repeats